MKQKPAENSEKAAKRPRGKGRPFQKGQSGNPGGRPPLPEDVKEALKALHPRAIQKLGEIIEKGRTETAVIRACEIVIERNMGKVAQPLIGPDGQAIQVEVKEDASPERIAAVLGVLQRVGVVIAGAIPSRAGPPSDAQDDEVHSS